MENIYILPTDKPSRLYVRNDVTPPFYSNFQGEPVNMFITSDSEIKEGDWRYNSINNTVYQKKLDKISFAYEYKIILTTDQDLIKDGVQEIDDEFLEYYISVPYGEIKEVEVEDNREMSNEFIELDTMPYKIIIPKEEPKQLFTKGDKVLFTGQMIDENVVDKLVTVFYTMGRGELDDMSDIMDEYTHIYRVWNKDLKHIPKEEPKQETLEEAKYKVYKEYWNESHTQEVKSNFLTAFKEGAKWQQEQDKDKLELA